MAERFPFGIGDFIATFKGDYDGHPFRGNQYDGGSGEASLSDSGGSSSNDSWNSWRKGDKPKAWTDVNVNKGDKFNVIGRDKSPIMELTVTSPDSYKRFHKVKVSKIINSNHPDRDIAEHYLDRERGGEISLVDADIPNLMPSRRAKTK